MHHGLKLQITSKTGLTFRDAGFGKIIIKLKIYEFSKNERKYDFLFINFFELHF